jgi:hypothetical protein
MRRKNRVSTIAFMILISFSYPAKNGPVDFAAPKLTLARWPQFGSNGNLPSENLTERGDFDHSAATRIVGWRLSVCR